MVNLKKENKRLWRGVFNFRSGLETEYARAFSPEQAKVFMMRRMAIKHEVSYQTVFGMFNGEKPNFIIEEEKHERSMVRR
jgi:hypothetical protein